MCDYDSSNDIFLFLERKCNKIVKIFSRRNGKFDILRNFIRKQVKKIRMNVKIRLLIRFEQTYFQMDGQRGAITFS